MSKPKLRPRLPSSLPESRHAAKPAATVPRHAARACHALRGRLSSWLAVRARVLRGAASALRPPPPSRRGPVVPPCRARRRPAAPSTQPPYVWRDARSPLPSCATYIYTRRTFFIFFAYRCGSTSKASRGGCRSFAPSAPAAVIVCGHAWRGVSPCGAVCSPARLLTCV